MKTRFYFTVFLCISLISGLSAQKSRNNQITYEEAVLMAQKHIAQYAEPGHSISTTSLMIDRSIPVFWLVELFPEGYIVIPVSCFLPGIIAYSFESTFGEMNSGNPLYNLLKADIAYRTSYYSANGYASCGLTSRSDNQLFEQWPATGDGWLNTNWTQNSPYNDLCPLDPVTHSRSYAGCPSVAMAQILNFHKNTNNTHFSDSDDYFHNYAGRQYWIDDDFQEIDFASFPQLNEYLDSLNQHWVNNITLTSVDKAALTFACGVACKQVYSSEGSGTFGVNQALDAYLRFGFATAELLDESDPDLWDRLKQNIKDTLPAHLAVVDESWQTGHNVVVDGYNSDDYYHINFGWGGTYNGWYLLPEELPYGLTVVEGVVIDIMKDTTVSVLTNPPLICKVYPNPSNEITNISFINQSNAEYTLSVYNTAGQIIEKIENITGTQVRLSNSNRKPGIYFFSLEDSFGTYYTNKFAVTR